MPLTETMKMGLHRVAWQIFFNRITRAFLEGWNYIWKYLLTTKVKRLREQYSQQLFIREMFCFMPVLPWIVVEMSGEVAEIHTRTDAKNLATTGKNNSLTWAKINNSHDFLVAKWNLFRKYFWPCSHFNSELFGRLRDEVIGEGRQFDHSTESSEVFGSWRSSEHQDSHGAQGILVHMVCNIHAHKGENCFLRKRL